LQLVKGKQRLSNCALVARAWGSAAAEATKDICITLDGSNSRAAGLSGWLEKHGSNDMHSIALTLKNSGEGEVTVDLQLQRLHGLQSLALVNSEPYPSHREPYPSNSEPYPSSKDSSLDSFKVLLHCTTLEQLSASSADDCSASQEGDHHHGKRWPGFLGAQPGRFAARSAPADYSDSDLSAGDESQLYSHCSDRSRS
jgi:hypothetical protein